jgi:hypothetical protein
MAQKHTAAKRSGWQRKIPLISGMVEIFRGKVALANFRFPGAAGPLGVLNGQ